MMELCGKYNTAKVFTDVIDENAISQIIEILNQPMAEGLNIRIMPDVHAGTGCTIGTTMTVKDKLVPNFVGVDIGCGEDIVDNIRDTVEINEIIKPIYNFKAGEE